MPRTSRKTRNILFEVSSWEAKPKLQVDSASDTLTVVEAQNTPQNKSTSLNFSMSQDLELSSTTDVSGIAFIAFFDDGSFSGHFLHVNNGVRGWLGISGHQILDYGYNQCSRDDDWELVKIKLSTKENEKWIEVGSERTGGDMAVLRRPKALTQTEMAMLEGWAEWQERVSLEVIFRCDKLLAEDAAQQFLAKYNPKFCGCDTIVNIGSMELKNLPMNLIQENHDFSI